MEQIVKSGDLKRVLRADMRALQRRVQGAIVKTAKTGVAICQKNVPDQFSEVRPGIKVVKDGRSVVIRSHAPHSDAVERGPDTTFESFSAQRHAEGGNTPDIPTLTAWVRAYGSGRGNDAASRMVKRGLKGFVQRARRGKNGQGRSSPIDAPRQLAYAILGSITKHRRPHRFMQASLPEIEALLDRLIQGAMDTKLTLGDSVAALAASSSITVGVLGGGTAGAAARRLARMSGKRARAPKRKR
jgi:hypothetical protein